MFTKNATRIRHEPGCIRFGGAAKSRSWSPALPCRGVRPVGH